MAAILAVFCIVSAGLLSYVYLFTKPKIDLFAKINFNNSLKEVLAEADRFNAKKSDSNLVYEGVKQDKIIGYAVPVSIRGYSGKIQMMIGIDMAGKVTGVKIIEQKETPGLGQNILKPNFLDQFINKSTADPIAPKKDIDAVAGATISSRAVCDSVREALGLVHKINLEEKGKQ
jgi:electron transport complex protein RnfG